MLIHDEIGETAARLPKERGYTREHPALECGISVSYLRRVERGDANPAVNELRLIAEMLEVNLRSPFEVPAALGLL